MRLCVLHNLYFYNHMMEEIRDALDAGKFAEYKKMRLEGFEEGKINSKDHKKIMERLLKTDQTVTG